MSSGSATCPWCEQSLQDTRVVSFGGSYLHYACHENMQRGFDEPEPAQPRLPVDTVAQSDPHQHCRRSSGIHGYDDGTTPSPIYAYGHYWAGFTFGSGKLDDFGFWEHPCAHCARESERENPEFGPCWPFSEQVREEWRADVEGLLQLS